jgi:hypothetical protein
MTNKEYQSVRELGSTPHGKAPESLEESSLSPHRAFVVQFRVKMGTAQGSFRDRVEHLVSGQASRFHSPEELLAFFTTILATVQE